MNKNDSEKIAAILEHLGHTKAENEFDSDITVLNTCSIRDKSERKVIGKLGQIKHHKDKKNPEKIIAVGGCMPQYQLKELQAKIPYVDILFGVNNIHRLPEYLDKVINKEKIAEIHEKMTEPENFPETIRDSEYQAWIPIMFGCNNFCTYCIVPYTRGREVSRSKENIFKEIKELDKTKYNKIVLLGQNVNSYGQGLYKDYDFADLLTDVSKIEGIKQVDFMTSHPKDISDKLINALSKIPVIGKEIHIALQSGDNEILEKMNRKYTIEQFKETITKIKKNVPGAKLSTDLIAGFPGETEKHFQNTLNAVKEIGFSRVNTAAYSPRQGTPAAKMEGQLSEKEKADRLQRLMKVVDEYSVK